MNAALKAHWAKAQTPLNFGNAESNRSSSTAYRIRIFLYHQWTYNMAIFEAKLLLVHPGFIKVTHCCRVRANSMIEALQEVTMHYCQRGVIVSIEIENMNAKYRSEYFTTADDLS